MRIISGFLKNRRLMLPPACYTRPTMDRTREAVFSILSSQRDFSFSGSLILDVFAGSGAYGLESLSRGAKHAFFIENPLEQSSLLPGNSPNILLSFCALGRALLCLKLQFCHHLLERFVTN